MVKQIVKDPFFLQQKSEPATEADKQVIQDLLDTLRANQDRCVGMAASMKSIIFQGCLFDGDEISKMVESDTAYYVLHSR